jgi:hypothetical protein
MNEYNSNSTNGGDNANNIQQCITSPTRENLLIDNNQCTDEHCNQLCSDAGGNNNETCGKNFSLHPY